MNTSNVKNVTEQAENINSLKGTLFSTLVFVGGGIVIFIVLLLALYMIRI